MQEILYLKLSYMHSCKVYHHAKKNPNGSIIQG